LADVAEVRVIITRGPFVVLVSAADCAAVLSGAHWTAETRAVFASAARQIEAILSEGGDEDEHVKRI
jgi:hypothetical protein